jgi:hypothetical protein
MAMGLGTFMLKPAVVRDKKRVTSMILNEMGVFISTPLLEGNGNSGPPVYRFVLSKTSGYKQYHSS